MVHVFALFGPILGPKDVWAIPEKEAAGRPLWADCGHYMGLNFGVFWQIKHNINIFLVLRESTGSTGVFLGDLRCAPGPPRGTHWR